MPWIYVLVASLFEVCWTIGLKYSKGFTVLWPSVVTAVAYVASLAFLAAGVKSLPVGTAYAVWTGIGVAGTALLGIVLFGESRDAVRLGFMALIVVGVAGLKWTARSQ